MKFVPRVPVDIGSGPLVKLFTDILKSLSNVLESSTYDIDVVWSEPSTIAVPLAGRVPRPVSPAICRLARAQIVGDLETPVNFGATAWKWLGQNQIQILHVDGLTPGVRYLLTFETVG